MFGNEQKTVKTWGATKIRDVWEKTKKDVGFYHTESAMDADSDRRDDDREQTIIIPRVHHFLLSNNRSEEQGVEACFQAMRAWILDEIILAETKENIANNTHLTPCGDFIRANRDALCTLDAHVMQAAQDLFCGVPEVWDQTVDPSVLLGGTALGRVQTAWRALSLAASENDFASPFIGLEKLEEIRLRLAYTWLLSTQPGLADITLEEQSESKAQMLDSLVLARREHNTDPDIEGGPISPIDYPSCFAGVKSRIALSWPQFQLMKSSITIQQVVVNKPVWSEIEYALGSAVAECARKKGENIALKAVDTILEEKLEEPGLSCYKNYLDYFFTVNREGGLTLRPEVYKRICDNLLRDYPKLHVDLTGPMNTKIWVKKDLMPVMLYPLSLPRLVEKSGFLYEKLETIAENPDKLQTIFPKPTQVPAQPQVVQSSGRHERPRAPGLARNRPAVVDLQAAAMAVAKMQFDAIVRAVDYPHVNDAEKRRRLENAQRTSEGMTEFQQNHFLGLVAEELRRVNARIAAVERQRMERRQRAAAQVQFDAIVHAVDYPHIDDTEKRRRLENAQRASAGMSEFQRNHFLGLVAEELQQVNARIAEAERERMERLQRVVVLVQRERLEISRLQAVAQMQFNAIVRAVDYLHGDDAEKHRRLEHAANTAGFQQNHFLVLVEEELQQVNARMAAASVVAPNVQMGGRR